MGGRTATQSSSGRWPVKPLAKNQLFPFKEGGSHCFLVSVDEQILGGRSHHRNRCYLKQMSLINLKSGGVFTRLHVQGGRESWLWWGGGRVAVAGSCAAWLMGVDVCVVCMRARMCMCPHMCVWMGVCVCVCALL